MSGFIATSSSSSEAQHISNNGFFPDIDIAEFRSVMRVDTTISEERVKQALMDAIINVNKELADWQNKAEVETLAAYQSETYGDNTKHQHLYQSAVFNRAKALLTETYRDFDSTKYGHKKADSLEPGIDDYFRKSKEAIRSFLGTPRLSVELI